MQLGSNANCTKNICCRVFADSPPADQITDPALPFGNSKCDSPPSLAQTLLDAMTDKKLIGDVDFAIFTGDVVEGDSMVLLVHKTNTSLSQRRRYMAGEPNVRET